MSVVETSNEVHQPISIQQIPVGPQITDSSKTIAEPTSPSAPPATTTTSQPQSQPSQPQSSQSSQSSQSKSNSQPRPQSESQILVEIAPKESIPGCSHLSNLSSNSFDHLLKKYRAALRWGQKTRGGKVQELGEEGADGKEGEEAEDRGGKRRKLLPHPTCETCSTITSKPFLCLNDAKLFCFSGTSDCHLRTHLQALINSDVATSKEKSTADGGDASMSNGAGKVVTNGNGTQGDSQNPILASEIHSGSLFCGECDDMVYDERFEEVVREEKHGLKGKKKEKLKNGSDEDLVEDAHIVLAPTPCKVPRGLRNLGATCFMNVVLQSFFHNPLLRNFFLSDRHSVGLCAWKDNCLACELGSLFGEFYAPTPTPQSKAAPYGPTAFLFCIWLARDSVELTSAGQHDAHELFISALNGIHAALVASRDRVSKSGKLPDWPHENLKSISPLESKSSFGHASRKDGRFTEEADGLCPCAVHRTFSGTIQSEVTCGNCGLSSSTLDPVLDLSLDIRPPNWKSLTKNQGEANVSQSQIGVNGGTEKEKKKNKKKEKEEREKREKKEREEADKGGGAEQDVEECLRRYCATEQLSSSDYTCQYCGQLSRATKQLSLSRLPPVLCIQLKRFEHNSSATKINTKVRFPQRLDVREFCTDAVRHANFRVRNGGGGEEALMEEKNSPGMSPDPDAYAYDLFTVIVHEGGMNTGHYRNFSKWKGEWYHFDDDKVTPCSISSVLDVRAYQLFYVRRNLQNVSSTSSK